MIIGLIPARSGSKGIPGKNIKLLGGYPLIAYSIVASKLSSRIDRTIVSTDSEEYAEIARFYGAEVPFLRPPELARDDSPDIEFVLHILSWFRVNEVDHPEYIVHLRPPTPLRSPALIDDAIGWVVSNKEATSLRSVYEAYSVYKVFQVKGDFLEGFFPDDPRPGYHNLPRQSFPPTYRPNGYVDVIKSKTIMDTRTLHGSRILPFIAPNVGELDYPEDFGYIEWRLEKYGSVLYDYLKEVIR